MSILLDSITFLWAVAMLFVYSDWLIKSKTWIATFGFSAAAMYVLAQSGWTTAFLMGDVWGRDLSNYLWFVFNSIVLALLTYLWHKEK